MVRKWAHLHARKAIDNVNGDLHTIDCGDALFTAYNSGLVIHLGAKVFPLSRAMDGRSPAVIGRVGQYKYNITNGGIGDASNSMNGHFIDLVLVDSLNSDCASGLEDGATVTTSHGSIGSSIHQ